MRIHVLAITLLIACSDEPSPVPVNEPSHLFSDMDAWEVVRPRAAVLPPEEYGMTVALLDPALEVDELADTLWVHRPLDNGKWTPRPDLEGEREDVAIWSFGLFPPVTILKGIPRRLLLRHPEIELRTGQGDLSGFAAHEFEVAKNRVVVALPAGERPPGKGFVLLHPALPRDHLGHLADLRRAPDALPEVHGTTLGKQARPAVLLSPPMALRRSIVVPEGGTLHFGVGLAGLGLEVLDGSLHRVESRSDGVGFRLTLEEDGAREVVWQSFVAPAESNRFHQADVDLQRWAGREVEIELETFASESDEGATVAAEEDVLHDFAFVSEPLLFGNLGRWKNGPNVVVLLLDTLRADALGCYGGEVVETPQLDRFAAEGTLFLNARASSPWTLPSHASLFSSLFPTQHGVVQHGQKVPSHLLTMPEAVRDAGWLTVAVTDGGVVSPASGFAQGFDCFDASAGGIAKSTDRFLRWIDGCQGRFFAFVHTYQVHTPYRPDEEFRARHVPEYSGALPREVDHWDLENLWTRLQGEPPADRDLDYVRSLYHAEVAQTDAAVGAFFDELRARGLWDNTLVIVTSDHGEEFWDHGDHGHGRTLYEEMLRIPMIARHPELFAAGQRVDSPVRLEDIAPTVTGLLGIATPAEWIGVSMADTDAPRDVLATVTHHGETAYSVVSNRHKWIEAEPALYRVPEPPGSQLFDLLADPGERAAVEDELAATRFREQLESLLSRYPLVVGESAEAVFSADEMEELRALGYVK